MAVEEIVMGHEELVSGAKSYTQLENNILISSSLKKVVWLIILRVSLKT